MNWPLAIAIWFWIAETSYFGWNAWPQSDVEMVCDGIAMLLLSLSFVAKRKTQQVIINIVRKMGPQ